jgi:hypothetical protein
VGYLTVLGCVLSLIVGRTVKNVSRGKSPPNTPVSVEKDSIV